MNIQHALRTILTLVAVFGFQYINAQTELKGRVLDYETGEPLAYASVYLNNTTWGAFTDEEGNFTLPYDPNFNEVVVSYLGYETLSHLVQPNATKQLITFRPSQIPELITPVTISSTRTENWERQYAQFKQSIIGFSAFGDKTKIINPEVIYFDSGGSFQEFEAFAREPIVIMNEALGYKLEYAMVKFKYNGRTLELLYAGYPKFTLLEGSKSKQKKWDKRRKEAYNGSFLHFINAIKSGNLEAEGFQVNRLRRIPNPDRPRQAVIDSIRQTIKPTTQTANGRRIIIIGGPKNEILSKANLPRYVDYLDKEPLDPADFLDTTATGHILQFEDHWQVMYKNERLDYMYRMPGKLGPPNIKTPQTSTIKLLQDKALFNDLGILVDPLAIRFEGYWAFEKLPHLLPLNYDVNQTEK